MRKILKNLNLINKTRISKSHEQIAIEILQNKELDEIRDLLSAYTKRAYLVGGFVRDSLLGKKNSDYDIEIYDISPKDFDEFMQKIGANGVGKSYFIYKFKCFDLGLPRTENKVGMGHQDFEVSYCNDEKMASCRRDFTLNSMMINIFNGELLDFWGGENDLKYGILRHINADKFCEDALRVLRGVGFAARFDFIIDTNTLKLMQSLDLSYLSKSRIAMELEKIFNAEFLQIAAKYLYKLDLFEKFFGLNPSQDELDFFCQRLENARVFVKSKFLFFYILNEVFSVNLEAIVKNLGLANSYLSVCKHANYKCDPSPKDMMKIALKMPLKSWLGLYNEKRINMAKKLQIYEQKFDHGVSTSEISALGFKGKDFGVEMERRKLIAIDEYLRSIK
ncbi:MAG: CCA tRNA nucleotidyltransferase [Campylobacter sp.]|nr:CCA tRNA nucleotidyltransferase [Campylobacter sp.]